MAAFLYLLALSSPAVAKIVANVTWFETLTLADIVVGQPLEGFVSFSIEFSSFPDFAGKSSPDSPTDDSCR